MGGVREAEQNKDDKYDMGYITHRYLMFLPGH